jgi:hypothetical protein
MADCDSEQALEYGDLSPLLDRVEKLRQVKAATSQSCDKSQHSMFGFTHLLTAMVKC